MNTKELSTKEILNQLDTNIDTGLSSTEANNRLLTYGKNEFVQKEETTL